MLCAGATVLKATDTSILVREFQQMPKQIPNNDLASHRQRLSVTAIPRINHPSPSPVDDWLSDATSQAGVAHFQEGYVACLVEKVSVRLLSILIAPPFF
jgi:hypothetical protein